MKFLCILCQFERLQCEYFTFENVKSKKRYGLYSKQKYTKYFVHMFLCLLSNYIQSIFISYLFFNKLTLKHWGILREETRCRWSLRWTCSHWTQMELSSPWCTVGSPREESSAPLKNVNIIFCYLSVFHFHSLSIQDNELIFSCKIWLILSPVHGNLGLRLTYCEGMIPPVALTEESL